MSLWDIKDLSLFLKVKPSTLYAWAAQGKIPHLKIHGLIRFRKEEIDDWVESLKQERPPVPPVRPSGKSHEEIDALIDRVKRKVYNTNRGRPDRDRAGKEDNDGPI